MFLAAESTASTSTFSGFDIIVLAFTVILFIALYRLLVAKTKNWFAILFCVISVATFILMDTIMIANW
jgi:hypothetical protein